MTSPLEWLVKPHREKREKLTAEFKRLTNLSEEAQQLNDYEAYQALQSSMRDTYWEMLTASFCETFTYILPHVLIMWLISFKSRAINLFGYEVPLISWYLALVLTIYFGKIVYRKKHKKYLQTKIQSN